MAFAQRVAGRLSTLRRRESVSQNVVARAIGLSVSGVSRLERGLRQVRVDQLVAWAGALGLRVDVVMWRADPDIVALGPLSDEDLAVLAEVAAVLPHLPDPVKRATIRTMREWKDEARSTKPAPAREVMPLANDQRMG